MPIYMDVNFSQAGKTFTTGATERSWLKILLKMSTYEILISLSLRKKPHQMSFVRKQKTQSASLVLICLLLNGKYIWAKILLKKKQPLAI